MEVIIVGGFIEVIELCESCNLKIVGIIDNNLENEYCGYPVIGKDIDAPQLFHKFNSIPVIITPDLPHIRMKLVKYYTSIGYSFTNVISPKAEVSKSAIIGKGVVVQTGVNISSNVIIGDFVKLNTNSNIMHNCKIEEFTTIAPNAVLLGKVNIKYQCYIGSNSTILPEITIQERVIVGAGAVVVKNVLKNKSVKGVPAK